MKALVVGLGRMGTFHAQALDDLGHHVTTVDPDPARGAHRLKLKPYTHFDVAVIATPIDTLPWVAASVAVMASPRLVLVEKPFAPTFELALEMVLALTCVGVERVACGYTERFNPIVRRLIVECQGHAHSVEFTRHNDRPSPDPRLDLWSHDVDLSYYLASQGVTFDGLNFDIEHDQPARERAITVHHTPDRSTRYDLTAHTSSPLHEQWHAFLEGSAHVATAEDAIRVLRTIEAAPSLVSPADTRPSAAHGADHDALASGSPP